MLSPFRFHFLFACIVLLMSACSSFRTTETQPTLLAFKANHSIQNWQLTGKIGLRNNQQSGSAYLNWQQCGAEYDIRINGPFGQGAAHLYGNENQATLESAEHGKVHAANPEQLLVQLGWPIPVSQLRYWIRGLPFPQGLLQLQPDNMGFEQAGWALQFPKTQTVDSYILPGKAIAVRRDLKVTLLLKHWNLATPCEPSS